MQITHIIRGEDHIINTPKQIALYRAFGYAVPQFAHIPLVLGPSGQKLSKREAATAVPDYREAGYLADALVNYLVRLGWAHGDQEIFSRPELIAAFTLEAISKSGAIFDGEKLNWLNAVYIRNASDEALLSLLTQYGVTEQSERAIAAIALYKDRVHTLKELATAVGMLIHGPVSYQQTDFDALVASGTANTDALLEALHGIAVWNSDEIQAAIKKMAAEKNIKIALLTQPIRLALTGISSGPGAFALLGLLDKEEALKRLFTLRSSIVRST